jgi:hypothetical protein
VVDVVWKNYLRREVLGTKKGRLLFLSTHYFNVY